MNINTSLALPFVNSILTAPAPQGGPKYASATFYGSGTKTFSGKKPKWDIIAAANKYPIGTNVTVVKITVSLSQKDGTEKTVVIKTIEDISKLTTTDPDPKEQRHALALRKYLARMIKHTFTVGDRGPDVEKGYYDKTKRFKLDVFDFYVADEELAGILGRIDISVAIVKPKK